VFGIYDLLKMNKIINSKLQTLIMMIKQYTFSIFLALVLLWGCEEQTVETVLQLGASPTLTSPASGSEYTLAEANASEVLTTFEWTEADFGYQAGITYRLEFDVAGNGFAEPITLGVINGLSISDVTQGKINNILLAKGLPFGFANELEVRVCATVSDLVDELCSDPLPIKVSPYQAEVIYPFLTVPGDYQGWAPEDEDYKVFSRKSDDIYEGYIYFDVEEAVYKYAKDLGWDMNWGDIEPDGILDAGGIDNNIPIEGGPGMFLLNCDLNTLEHSNLKTDWGVLGDATPTGWDADTDLTWDGEKLTVTLDLSAGNLKFRANDDWEINFGDDFTNGTLEADGADIPVTEAGNYTINLYLNVSDYYYELNKN
jgi:hypothetical protein